MLTPTSYPVQIESSYYKKYLTPTRLARFNTTESTDRAIQSRRIFGILSWQANWHDIFAKRDAETFKNQNILCHKCNTSSSHIGPWPGPKKPFFLATAIPPYPKDLQMTTAVAFVKSSSHTVPHTP
ncbi:hypothetical protein ALC56_02090 [Trachymyrmex septentrionalis]|uniref:Uncharacterized protein n=1 Tax=Trachymyrmex septentrionalis TaxID=34720 RepID=A0A195FU00_9HYME|nr:hypothetical protein ALC56_02090 [Trachymyrmex septentrionalis]